MRRDEKYSYWGKDSSISSDLFNFPSFFSFKRKDRKKTVSVDVDTEEKSETVSVVVNLDYLYTYDDIKAIWAKRVEIAQDWCEEQGVKRQNQLPIVVPEFEISSSGKPGNIGNLTYYLQNYVIKDSDQTPHNKKHRLVYIPINEGASHWATLFLYVNAENHIASAIFLNSTGSNTTGQLKEDFLYVKLVRAADPTFQRPVRYQAHILQSDGSACGVCSIENAIKCVRLAYRGARNETFTPTKLDDNQIAVLRAHHVKALGFDHRFNQIQCENKQNVESPSAHYSRMNKLSVREKLNGSGELVILCIKKLDVRHQTLLRDAFMPVKLEKDIHEEHSEHLTRIRAAIISIKNDLVEEDRDLKTREEEAKEEAHQKEKEHCSESFGGKKSDIERERQELDERIENFDIIIKTLTGNKCRLELIREYDSNEFAFPIKIVGEFNQVLVIGEELSGRRKQSAPTSFWLSSLFGKGRGTDTSSSSSSIPPLLQWDELGSSSSSGRGRNRDGNSNPFRLRMPSSASSTNVEKPVQDASATNQGLYNTFM